MNSLIAYRMSDSCGLQAGVEKKEPEVDNGPDGGNQCLCTVTLCQPTMNENQNGFLDQQGNWLPAALAEIGKQQGNNLEQQDGTHKEETDILCGGSTESSLSGHELTELESNGTSSHGFEPSGNSVQNSSGQDRFKGGGGSSNSKPLHGEQSHEKLTMVIREMKQYLPAEKVESCGKGSTLNTLNYALKCVRQIQTDSKAFPAFGEPGGCQAGGTVYSIEELAAVASEHAPKNTDTFVAVFSLLSGQMVHVSKQAASILRCKKRFLDSSCFAELLAPQDLGIFYTHTSQSHLPLWDMEMQTASLYEYAHVKSFFCRLRGGKDQGQETCYHPFRITPYLVNVCDSDPNEAESCCLALAEKMHSGYEAPRIPVEKRIFTTTHTPGCVFLEIDDRAVPLLGYLPQELIGTSILMHLHPEDRPVMVAIHRKVLKFAGRPPFEHSPIRFCTWNGDYVILDTSWSSFVNPWSRKVVFIIGRHKVRTSPLNEDVFAARSREMSCVDKEIWELQGQIYKLLLQPVHSNGSSGYGSLVSNGSYEHYISVASSSDSNGNCMEEIQKEPMTRQQQVFVDVNRLKNVGQQLYIETHSKQHMASRLSHTMKSSNTGDPLAASSDGSGSTHHLLSYQQINCMDSIIRYLESCNIPALKRKCESSTNISSSDDDKQAQLSQKEGQILADASRLGSVTSQPPAMAKPEGDVASQAPVTVVGAPVAGLELGAKALSVVSVTSQCSYSSTLVHFPHPESEATALEEAPLPSEQVELPPASTPGAAAAALEEEIRLVGLTKEVLSAHTQKEEQNYVDRFRQRVLLSPYRLYLPHGGAGSNPAPSQDLGDFPSKQTNPASWKRKGKQEKSRCQKPLASSGSNSYNQGGSCQKTTADLGPPWAPSKEPPPGPSSVPLPVDPYSVAPLGGSPALPVLPSCLPCSIQPVPAFHAPYTGNTMAVLLHGCPMYPPLPQPPFPVQHPSPSTSYPCAAALPLGPPAAVPAPVVPPPSAPFPLEEVPQEAPGDRPPLFSHSRSSSPLQLDLLQEELPKPPEPLGKAQAETLPAELIKCGEDGGDGAPNNGHSVSSELLDLLLLEDPQSGAGSAAFGSGSAESSSCASGSSSSGASGCGAGSRSSSRDFASNDSFEVSKRGKENQEEERKGPWPTRLVWKTANCLPEPVLMTYQIPKRIKEEVLKEDLEKLAALGEKQPRFTEEQEEELAEVHPWMRTQTIPQEINTQGCITCDGRNASCRVAVPDDRDPPEEDSRDPLLGNMLPPQSPA